MTEFFLNIVNMSISASWIVLAVLILRLLLKKAPKWITVLLWGIVAFRLICPFSIESALSLIPSTQTINPEYAINPPRIDSGVPIIDNTINPIISGAMVTVQPEKDINFFHIIMPYLAGLWLVGIFALLLYTVISYVRLKKKIGTAVLYKDNIFQSESVISPFVLGIIKPKIYLPFNMSDSDMENVVAHEQAHIKRKDHLWKPLGFLLLTIHWFNPLMWVGYIMLCKDIELACDEKVVKNLDTEQRADYSQALLSCSVNRRMIAACPLAFGEVGVKSRIKTVLNYKKPAFWIIIIAIIASVIAAVCFLTNPVNNTKIDDQLKVFLDMKIAEHMKTEHTGDNFIAVDYEILHVDSWLNDTTIYAWVLYEEYSYDGKLNLEVGAHLPSVISVTKNDGKYTDDMSYWTPRDGSLYEEDIKSMFPRKLWSKALDSQRYINKQKANCENAAREYFSSISNVGGADNPNNIITEIIDRTVTEKIPTDQAMQPFCADEKYIYSFPSIRSEYVIVKFNNGDEMTVSTALGKGLITIADLDKWKIQYSKKEYDGDLELNENGDIVRISSFPKPNELFDITTEPYSSDILKIVTEKDTYSIEDKVIKYSITNIDDEEHGIAADDDCFSLQILVDGEWKRIGTKIEHNWNSLGQILNPNQTEQREIDLEEYFNLPLEKGTYRIVVENLATNTFEIS